MQSGRALAGPSLPVIGNDHPRMIAAGGDISWVGLYIYIYVLSCVYVFLYSYTHTYIHTYICIYMFILAGGFGPVDDTVATSTCRFVSATGNYLGLHK